MIYCAAGWVRVVYEDQGLPFVLEAGECVLQPPNIRHRVLADTLQDTGATSWRVPIGRGRPQDPGFVDVG